MCIAEFKRERNQTHAFMIQCFAELPRTHSKLLQSRSVEIHNGSLSNRYLVYKDSQERNDEQKNHFTT